ncbi:MAG: phosphatase PAP2 family protein [Tepidamorphaceae bacterium]
MIETASEKRPWQPSAFGIFARPQTAAALVAAWLAAALFFNLFPQIDLAVSHFFFDEDAMAQGLRMHGLLFPLLTSGPLNLCRDIMQYGTVALAVVVLASIIVETFLHHSLIDSMVRARTTLLLVYLLGPLLFANVLTKPLVGRPRPLQTDVFGGDAPFVPAAQFSSNCTSSCSFVSGEAASHFWLFGLLAIVPQHLRLAVLVPLTVLVGFSAMLRVSFGAHFLSDVVLGGFSTLVLYALTASVLEYARFLPWIARRVAD